MYGISINKNLKILEFVLRNSSPTDINRIQGPVILGEIQNFKKNSENESLYEGTFWANCALAGKLDIFKESESRNHEWNNLETLMDAIFGGRVDLVDWLLEKALLVPGNNILDVIIEFAAEVGKLEIILRLVKKTGYPWSTEISAAAAAGGHVHILDYVWENGLPMDLKKICASAIKGSEAEPWNDGNLRVLKWVRKKNGTWDFDAETMVQAASLGKDHKILQWLVIHGYVNVESIKKYLGDGKEGKIDEEEFQRLKEIQK